jgi:CBS domain-containing protein
MAKASWPTIAIPIQRGGERDILKSIAYRKTKPETKVEEIMSEPLISVEANATLGEAAETMIRKSRLLVTQNDKYMLLVHLFHCLSMQYICS